MKKMVVVLVVLVAVALVAFAGATPGKISLKTGDQVYACNCGAGCPCLTISRNEGNCSCNRPMVKAKVTKVEGEKVMLKAESWDKERPFKNTGKYACDCGASCACDSISQNPGKCSCGKEMKKVS